LTNILSTSIFCRVFARLKQGEVRKEQGYKRIEEDRQTDRQANLCLLSECRCNLTDWMMQQNVVAEFYSSGLVLFCPSGNYLITFSTEDDVPFCPVCVTLFTD